MVESKVMVLRCAAVGLLLLGVASCATPSTVRSRGASGAAGAAGTRSSGVVHEPMATCSSATRAARATLMQLGYTIASVQEPTAEEPGYVVGTRETGWTPRSPEARGQYTATIKITCSDTGADFEAFTDESWTRQISFPTRFAERVSANVQRPRRRSREAPASGLNLRVEPQRPADARAEFGADLTASGITAVKIEIRNNTGRRYAFQQTEVVLITVEGKRERPMSLAEARALVTAGGGDSRTGDRLAKNEMRDAEIEPGAKAEGYLYFAASAYRRARVVLFDVESEESEGFSVAF